MYPAFYTRSETCGSWGSSPSGLEGYVVGRQIASKLSSGEIDEEEHRRSRAELGERYGVSWHDERIPEARARFGIGP